LPRGAGGNASRKTRNAANHIDAGDRPLFSDLLHGDGAIRVVLEWLVRAILLRHEAAGLTRPQFGIKSAT